MALDPSKLSRNELVQLLNSTALGESITRSRLDRQMNRAGRRWHDGRRTRLLEYLRWLIREVDRPAKPKIDARAADLERKNTETWRTQNIAPLPDIADMARRERARADFRFFCETYFTSALYRGWSEDLLRVIEKIERAVKEGGLFAFAMPRGSGKTTLARLSALWAILSGYRPFVCLIGGSQERAVELLAPICKGRPGESAAAGRLHHGHLPAAPAPEQRPPADRAAHRRPGDLLHVGRGQAGLPDGRRAAQRSARGHHYRDLPGRQHARPAAHHDGRPDAAPVAGATGRSTDPPVGPLAFADTLPAPASHRRRARHGRTGRVHRRGAHLHEDLRRRPRRPRPRPAEDPRVARRVHEAGLRLPDRGEALG